MKGVAESEGQASDATHGLHGWRVVQLGDISTVSAGGTPSRTNSSYWNGDIPWVTTSEVDFCRIDIASESITNDGLKNSAAKLLPAGTLLIALYGQGKTRGKTAMLGIAAATNQACAAITLHADVSREFIFYSLVSQYERIRGLSNTGNQENLNGSLVRSIPVLLPPSEEQHAIARALSDVDALLAGLDRLIAKKRDLKQAAMQQLLTGETRLPGFEGAWETHRLGDIAHVKTGKRNNEDKVDAGHYPFFVRSEVVERINTYSYDGEAILVPGEGRIGDIFHYINGRFDVHQRVYAITRFVPGISGQYVHLYMSMRFGDWAMQNTVKATVDSLRLPTFLTFELDIPPTLAEQVAIAASLTDMDQEITSLEARRSKTCALKQAMMQELLTGRIRLI